LSLVVTLRGTSLAFTLRRTYSPVTVIVPLMRDPVDPTRLTMRRNPS